MGKIKFVQIGKERGDCTALYDVILDRQYKVKEFVELILSTQTDEWGHIGIKSEEEPFFGYPVCKYRYGKLTTNPLPNKILEKKIKYVRVNGGWTLMDYLITLE